MDVTEYLAIAKNFMEFSKVIYENWSLIMAKPSNQNEKEISEELVKEFKEVLANHKRVLAKLEKELDDRQMQLNEPESEVVNP